MISIMYIAFPDLFEKGRIISLAIGQPLFLTGDRVRSMFVVTEGQIDLVRHTRAGARLTQNRVLPGSVPAEASAYSETYHCDGVARIPSQVRSIPVSAFRDKLHDTPDAADAWAAQLAYALQKARMRSEIRSLKTVAERLDAWLGEDRSLPKKGQIQDLAQVLGVSREALYRELAQRRN